MGNERVKKWMMEKIWHGKTKKKRKIFYHKPHQADKIPLMSWCIIHTFSFILILTFLYISKVSLLHFSLTFHHSLFFPFLFFSTSIINFVTQHLRNVLDSEVDMFDTRVPPSTPLVEIELLTDYFNEVNDLNLKINCPNFRVE